MVGQAKIMCILFNIHCFSSCLINVASTFHVLKYNYSADFTQEIVRIDNIVFMKVDHKFNHSHDAEEHSESLESPRISIVCIDTCVWRACTFLMLKNMHACHLGHCNATLSQYFMVL